MYNLDGDANIEPEDAPAIATMLAYIPLSPARQHFSWVQGFSFEAGKSAVPAILGPQLAESMNFNLSSTKSEHVLPKKGPISKQEAEGLLVRSVVIHGSNDPDHLVSIGKEDFAVWCENRMHEWQNSRWR